MRRMSLVSMMRRSYYSEILLHPELPNDLGGTGRIAADPTSIWILERIINVVCVRAQDGDGEVPRHALSTPFEGRSWPS